MPITFTETEPGVWFDQTQNYRISVARLIQEMSRRVVYYASVLCERLGTGERYWALCGAHRPYKSIAAAQRAVKKHRRLWVSAIRASRTREPSARQQSLERIKLRGHVGVDRTRNYLFSNLPMWVRERAPKAPERIIAGYRKLCEHVPKGPTETSPHSVPSSTGSACDSVPENLPASSVSAAAESANATTRRARPEAPAGAHAKRVRRPTATPSTTGERKPRSTTASKRTAKRDSKG